ncbi:hypothetical protein FQR65_LT16916 [Abscondita terminalis]|nr:hypothetical protein FQR65_LT16916 [Abscondita terminalis]
MRLKPCYYPVADSINRQEVTGSLNYPKMGYSLSHRYTLGRQNPEYYEVLKGLKPGDKVITSSYENLRTRNHFPQQLSGGQQQRVAVARAVINNPKLILADEPTGNLDSNNGNEVMQLLTELNESGTTIIMVTHSEHDAKFAHRVIRMLDGENEPFFDVFSFDFIKGNPAVALKEPNSIVITESTAKRYFGEEEALGESLTMNNTPWKVTGVIKDIPSYSQIQFNIIGPYHSLSRFKNVSWGAANDISYLLLKSPNDIAAVQSKIDNYLKEQFAEEIAAGYQAKFPLQKLLDVRLHSTEKILNQPVTFVGFLLFSKYSVLKLSAAANPLTKPDQVAVTQKTATKLFGDENPLGRTVLIQSKYPLTVTAVVKDPPSNSSVYFEVLADWNLRTSLGYNDQSTRPWTNSL